MKKTAFLCAVFVLMCISVCAVEKKEDDQTPQNAFPWREVYYYESADPAVNGNEKAVSGKRHYLKEGHHGANGNAWGLWCHSFYDLVPPEKYAAHPEYFAMIDGKYGDPKARNRQLCMTNPDVINIVKKELGKRIKAHPEFAYWSLSQMDFCNQCQCPRCAAEDKKAGSPIGSILYLINEVARAYPNVKIATLSYWYSRKAPQGITLEPNVCIQLCNIECMQNACDLPLATAPAHAAFRRDIQAWSKLCKNIVMWDYVVCFNSLLMPFPNWDVLQRNVQFFKANHVSGLFEQGNRERGGEFAQLRVHVLTELMKDPEIDVQACMKAFLNDYYGAAGPFLYDYIRLQIDQMNKGKKRLNIFSRPDQYKNSYLSEANIRAYEALFDKAEAAVAKQKTHLKRVQKERLGLMFVRLANDYGTNEERLKLLETFYKQCQKNNIYMLSEVERPGHWGNLDTFYHAQKARLTPKK